MTATSSASTCAERRHRLAALSCGLALSILAAGCGAASVAATAGSAGSAGSAPGGRGARATATAVARATATATSGARATGTGSAGRPTYAVRELVLHLVDHSRTIRYPGHRAQPRPLVTVVRYPVGVHRPVPLVVFGHGFAVTPAYYWRLLQAWAAAGYVVAAPVFPLENQHAPGGPNEADLVNQPRDMSFVITSLRAASAGPRGPLAGLVSRREVAVSGQSDGGETALAAAYDRHYLDRRIRAAVILSGAELPGAGRFYFLHPSPPLLAAQGTADTINLPRFTYAFFAAAPRPKFLLELLGAPHLPPYTDEQPQLSVVERVSIAFLDRYLKGEPGAADRMSRAGQLGSVARLVAHP
jgi:dienelactone hydrolase